MQGPREAEGEPEGAAEPRVLRSRDLPLLLLVAAVTFIVLSELEAAPELMLAGVLLTTVLGEAITTSPRVRALGRRRLLGLTGLLTLGWTGREVARGRTAATAPSAAAVCVTAGVASVLVVGLVSAVESARGDALLVDRPTSFLSDDPPADGPPAGGYATAEAAIAAFAKAERWTRRGWNYAGDCEEVAREPVREAVCSAPWPAADVNRSLASGERAYIIAPAFSDVHYTFLAVARRGGRWHVDRELRPRR